MTFRKLDKFILKASAKNAIAGVGATEEWQKWRERWFLYHVLENEVLENEVVRLLSSAPAPQKTRYKTYWCHEVTRISLSCSHGIRFIRLGAKMC